MTKDAQFQIDGFETAEHLTLGAVGDIAFRRGVAEGIKRWGMDWPFAEVQQQLDRADLLFGNMETVLVPDDYPPGQVDPAGMVAPFNSRTCAAGLRRAGFRFLNLAQNHILDAGTVGLHHTQSVLEAEGVATGGVGSTQDDARRPVVVVAGGLRIGLLCYCEDNNYSLGTTGPCHAYFETESALSDVARLRSAVDIVVVSVHADLEFMRTPSVPRRDAFRAIAEGGADLILGHHPHVPQGCERRGHALIVYSLGNFIFPSHSSPYMRAHGPDTARSFMLLVQVSRKGIGDYERVPLEIGPPPNERPDLLKGQARDAMLRYLDELDALVKDDVTVQRLWRQAALRKLTEELGKVVRVEQSALPAWRRKLGRLLGLNTPVSVEVDVERILDELVGRWWLTAENRAWVQEVARAGREQWDSRNARDPDPLHRPHYAFNRAPSTSRPR